MRARPLAPALALLAAAATAAPPDARKPEVPFYRQYLVPGNPLDDQILEQEKRVEASPQDAALRTDFGNLLGRRRFPDQAAEQYEIAAKLDPKNFVAPYNLGLLLETQGKINAAISAYKKSIKRKPGFPPSHFHLGLLYERKNRLDDAVAEYAKALRIDPAMRDAKRNPLVVDSEVIYRASLANYAHDRAVAAMQTDSVFFEEARFRRVPVDRALSAEEVAAQEELESAPREIGPAGAAGSEGTPPARRGARPPTAAQESGAPGMRARPTSTDRTPRGTRPNAAPGTPPGAPQAVPPPLPTPVPEEPGVAPETVPEPTPGPPMEVEPS